MHRRRRKIVIYIQALIQALRLVPVQISASSTTRQRFHLNSTFASELSDLFHSYASPKAPKGFSIFLTISAVQDLACSPPYLMPTFQQAVGTLLTILTCRWTL